MANLSPILSAGIGYEQPVEQPSFLAAASSVIGNFLQAKQTTGGGGAGDRRQQIEDEGFQWVASEYARAEDLRTQGYTKEADLVMRQANVQASIHYGINTGGERFRAFQEAYTGQKAETVGFNAEEVARMELMQRPEFATAVAAAPSDYTPEEKENYALATMQTLAAADMQIQLGRAKFTQETQNAYIQVLDTQQSLLMGIASQTDQGGLGVSGLEDIQTFKKDWNAIVLQKFSRPAGVTDQDWQPIQDRIDRVTKGIEVLEAYYGSANITERNTTRQAQIQENLGNLVLKVDPSVAGQLAASAFFSGNTDAFTTLLNTVKPESMARTMQLILEQPVTAADLADPNREGILPASKVTELEGMKPAELLETASTAISLVSNPQFGSLLSSSPQAAEEYVNVMATGLTAFGLVGSADRPDWVSAGKIKELFSPNFYANLDTLETINPEAAQELRLIAVDAIDRQSQAISLNITSREQGGLFVFDRKTGSFVLNPDPIKAVGALTSEVEVNRLKEVINTYYGGDIGAMMRDRGAKVLRASARTIRTGEEQWDPSTPFREEADNASFVYNQVLRPYFESTPPEQSVKMAEALTFLDKQREAIISTAPQATTEAPAGGEEAGLTTTMSQKNAPEETVPPTREGYNPGAVSLVSLIDKTEGGADYNTLYGFSNREGGPFAGVNVSDMTIGEAIAFANGEYGAWSQGQLGYKATPMGRYQIVGSTLEAAANAIGLDPNMKFSPQVQDAIFAYLASERLRKATTQEEKRAGLRAEWAGFKNVSDEELDAAIAAFESGKPMDFGGIAITTNPTPTTSPRPLSRPQGLSVGGTESATGGGSTGTGVAPTTNGEPTSAASTEAPSGTAAQEGKTASQKATQLTEENLSARSRRVLERAGKKVTDVVPYRSIGEAIVDQQNGKIPEDALVSVAGEVFQL